MLKNECLNSVINPNSLKMDKELTRMARDIATKINQRMSECERKTDDLQKYSKEVTLRVTSAASKMANLKNHKAVKHVISNQNIPNPDDLLADTKKSDIYTPKFLESFKNAIMESRNTINYLENPAVFSTGNIGDQSSTNGYTNGHSTNGHSVNGRQSVESTDDFEENEIDDHPDEQNGSRVEHGMAEEKRNIDVTLVEQPDVQVRTVDDNQVLHIPKASPTVANNVIQKHDVSITIEQTKAHKSDVVNNLVVDDPLKSTVHVENLESTVQVMRNDPPEPSHRHPQDEKPAIPKHPMRTTAMASVIDQMKEKVAAKPKFFDSDSDSDTGPLSIRRSKPSSSQTPAPKKIVTVDPKLSVPSASSSTAQPGPSSINSTAKPPVTAKLVAKAESSYRTPNESHLPRKVPGFESKDIDAKKLASKLFGSDSESDTDIFKPQPKPIQTTSSKKQPVLSASVNKPAVVKSEKIVEADLPKPAVQKGVKNPSPPPAAKPIVKKSLFSSDSDSEDDFLKSFSKTKPAAKPTTKSVPKPIEKPVEKLLVAPKIADTLAETPVVPLPVTTTTAIPRKVETKTPVAKSLFDDSDSDSDLFSPTNKLKIKAAPQKESPPPVSHPEMEPSSSEQTEPLQSKKEPKSEGMSAKISLIEGLQKSFRLPGAPLNIPIKTTPVTDEKESSSHDDDPGVGAILKSRVRGPPNRRPPTRTNMSN